MATLPALAFALSLALFVPKLDSLVGLLTSVCVPSVMLAVPAGFLLLAALRRRRHLASAWAKLRSTHDSDGSLSAPLQPPTAAAVRQEVTAASREACWRGRGSCRRRSPR